MENIIFRTYQVIATQCKQAGTFDKESKGGVRKHFLRGTIHKPNIKYSKTRFNMLFSFVPSPAFTA